MPRYPRSVDFDALLGKTLTRIDNDGNEKLTFYCSDGVIFKMHHEQDCCERVAIHEVVGGDLSDICGEPILMAQATSHDGGSGEGDDSATWTFYKLSTNSNTITISWLGTSNGYYSESVSFLQECGRRAIVARAQVASAQAITAPVEPDPYTHVVDGFWYVTELDTMLTLIVQVVEEMWGKDVYYPGDNKRHKLTEFKWIVRIPEKEKLKNL